MPKFANREQIINALYDNRCGNGGGPVVYQDDDGHWHSYTGELHALYLGPTNKGKSQYGIFPLIKSLITNGESIVLADPKGECTAYIQHLQSEGLVPEEAEVKFLDMTHPNESMGYNPFEIIYDLLNSEDIAENQLGETFLEELVNAICIEASNVKDSSFWNNCSKSLFSGLIYMFNEMSLGKECPPLSYFTDILNSASSDMFTNGDFIDDLCSIFDEGDGRAYNNISLFTKSKASNSPMFNTVFRDIRTTYISDLNKLQKGSAINGFMSHSDFSISDLDLNKQNIICLIKPDNFDTYDTITGIMINQLSQFLILKADNYYEERRLPVRVNFILEELGNIGRSIPNLPQLMTAGRSRNIRLNLVLQDLQQLEKIYKDDARTILANIGVTIAYGSEDTQTRLMLSSRCGHYVSEYDPSRELPVLRPEDIGKMRRGQALIFLPSGIVFVSDLAEIRKPAGYPLNKEAFLIHEALSPKDLRDRFSSFIDMAFLNKYEHLLTGEIPNATAEEINTLSTVAPPYGPSRYDRLNLAWGAVALLYQKRFGIEADYHLLDTFKSGIPFSIPDEPTEQHYSWLIWALKELKLYDFSTVRLDNTNPSGKRRPSAKKNQLLDIYVD